MPYSTCEGDCMCYVYASPYNAVVGEVAYVVGVVNNL